MVAPAAWYWMMVISVCLWWPVLITQSPWSIPKIAKKLPSSRYTILSRKALLKGASFCTTQHSPPAVAIPLVRAATYLVIWIICRGTWVTPMHWLPITRVNMSICSNNFRNLPHRFLIRWKARWPPKVCAVWRATALCIGAVIAPVLLMMRMKPWKSRRLKILM